MTACQTRGVSRSSTTVVSLGLDLHDNLARISKDLDFDRPMPPLTHVVDESSFLANIGSLASVGSLPINNAPAASSIAIMCLLHWVATYRLPDLATVTSQS